MFRPEDISKPPRIGDYSLGDVIGCGAFSVVVMAIDTKTGRKCACKITPKDRLHRDDLVYRFRSEIDIFRQLAHPNVVELYDVLKDEQNFYVLMEFCPRGELFQYIVDKAPLEEPIARFIVREILHGLQHMHELGFAHRDLKPENILLSENHIKLSDFGLSKYIGVGGRCTTPCGSPCYASPECLVGDEYCGMTSDLWSTGVILFAVVTGQLPWTKRKQDQLFEQIKRGEYTVPENVPEKCRDFITGLLTVSATERLTLDAALGHPWLMEEEDPLKSVKLITHRLVSLRKADSVFEDDEMDCDIKEQAKAPSARNASFDQMMRMVVAVPERATNKQTRTLPALRPNSRRDVTEGSVPIIFPKRPLERLPTNPAHKRYHLTSHVSFMRPRFGM